MCEIEGICDVKNKKKNQTKPPKPLKNGFPLSSLPPSLWTSLGVCISMLGNHCLGKLVLKGMLCLSVLLGQKIVLILTVVGRIMAPQRCQHLNSQNL